MSIDNRIENVQILRPSLTLIFTQQKFASLTIMVHILFAIKVFPQNSPNPCWFEEEDGGF